MRIWGAAAQLSPCDWLGRSASTGAFSSSSGSQVSAQGTSAVALLQEAKSGRNTAFIFQIAARLLPDRDDMVEKGVGWLLKETYPNKPRETVAFLTARSAAASRLTLRYAAEKMTPAHRAKVLAC